MTVCIDRVLEYYGAAVRVLLSAFVWHYYGSTKAHSSRGMQNTLLDREL